MVFYVMDLWVDFVPVGLGYGSLVAARSSVPRRDQLIPPIVVDTLLFACFWSKRVKLFISVLSFSVFFI